MKISRLFGGKKEGGQEEIDQLILENVTGQVEDDAEGDVPEEGRINATQNSVDLRAIQMTMDKIRAQIEALNQLRQINERRFQTISEEIGDLRQRSMQREKDLNELRLKSSKAIDLVSSVQPEKLRMDVEREDAKLMKVKAKEDAIKAYVDNIVEELKDLRSVVSTFRGTESLIKLNDDVKKELMEVKKIQSNTERHADKVEDIFIKIEKRYGEFLTLSEKFRALEKEFNDVMKDAARFKTESKNLATKKDLDELEKSVNKSRDKAGEVCDELEKKKPFLKESMENTKNALKRLEDLEKVLKTRLAEVDDAISRLTLMEQREYITKDKFEGELDDLYKSVLERLEKQKAQVEV
jgi:chromosome segregation ATPase